MSGAACCRRRVLVTGRVQGVFFRGATEREARRAGVAGWVRNRSDGRVEAAFEGPLPAVEALVRFCHKGPDGARVEDVQVFEEEPESLASFEVWS